jgi:hypothetical protein
MGHLSVPGAKGEPEIEPRDRKPDRNWRTLASDKTTIRAAAVGTAWPKRGEAR